MPVVGTNTAANSAIRFLNNNSSMATSSVSKLASGSRIVRASDDAAGLAISSKLSADTTALKQAATNASQGASVLQVADGGLARVADVLQRMKTLAAQSLSGVPTDTERGYIDAEFGQLQEELTGIATTTRFNGSSLIDGTLSSQDYFVGTSVADTISVDISSVDVDSAGLSLDGTVGVATATSAAAAMTALDTAIGNVSNHRATVGALISRFETRGQAIATSIENIEAANSAIKDVDLAAEQSKLVSSQVLVQAAVSALSQANQIPQTLLRVLQ